MASVLGLAQTAVPAIVNTGEFLYKKIKEWTTDREANCRDQYPYTTVFFTHLDNTVGGYFAFALFTNGQVSSNPQPIKYLTGAELNISIAPGPGLFQQMSTGGIPPVGTFTGLVYMALVVVKAVNLNTRNLNRSAIVTPGNTGFLPSTDFEDDDIIWTYLSMVNTLQEPEEIIWKFNPQEANSYVSNVSNQRRNGMNGNGGDAAPDYLKSSYRIPQVAQNESLALLAGGAKLPAPPPANSPATQLPSYQGQTQLTLARNSIHVSGRFTYMFRT